MNLNKPLPLRWISGEKVQSYDYTMAAAWKNSDNEPDAIAMFDLWTDVSQLGWNSSETVGIKAALSLSFMRAEGII